ncbi:outer envelope membrane protein 7-like [Melia azedarach]|uniref:Outer envelope membrane protein 7-like n=1 Tax=Melia azedarach TaxID=155640 RepID=A0ACC1YG18_MELAZ|nr:outer envelope membrane protein 7-like [Melia azedarach]
MYKCKPQTVNNLILCESGEARRRRKRVKRRMRERAKMNAIRSGIVVVGFLAFGYLSLELGFKPFLLKAQQLQEQEPQQRNTSTSTEESL